ncbi:helical backbone metal receptor [uncultured Dokdonia sp.]|uniref:ABC transporter substrate-binding protein n=1 Tax=uncultured Dokdonia sp. TaxID=575653 RepID=UPI002630ACAD|nr:helical backbone metal receptor [uncultured Dokdonia sp.]
MEYKDQLGRLLQFSTTPTRIVSLVPSLTELLVDLGLRDHIMGLTKFCVHPNGLIKEKIIVGGTKQVHIDRVKALQPDIILCNKEENTEQIVDDLEAIAPVHISDIKNIEDTLSLIRMYGAIFQIQDKAHRLVDKIQKKHRDFSKGLDASVPCKKVAYFIWKDPWMVAGNDTFIDYLLGECGYENVFKTKEGRYPEVSLDQLQEVDYIFLSSEPFPFAEKHIQELMLHTRAKIMLVDGEYFSWYGSRLLGAFDYFKILQKQLKL